MPKRKRRPSVAVVEDDDDFRFLLEYWLSPQYLVVGFKSGEDFLAKMGVIRPHLAILDLKLQGCNGLEIAARIRDHGRTRTIPVLFLTGMPRSSFECVLSDASTAFLSKPLERAHLLECAERLLDRTTLRAPTRAVHDR